MRKGLIVVLALALSFLIVEIAARWGGKTVKRVLEAIGKRALIAIAALAAVGSFFKFALTGHSILAYSLWLSAFVILWFRLLKLWERNGGERPAGILRRITVIGLCAFLLVFSVTEAVLIVNARTDKDPEAEYLVVLGAGVNGTVPSWSLKDRLTAAYDYLAAYPDSVAILSGAQGEHEEISEAECMFRWLVEKGIDPSRLIKEEEAKRTLENLSNSFAIIREREQGRPVRVAVVSSEYHLLRARLLSRRLGMDVIGVAATTELFTLRVNHFIRECLGIWYYLLIENK